MHVYTYTRIYIHAHVYAACKAALSNSCRTDRVLNIRIFFGSRLFDVMRGAGGGGGAGGRCLRLR